MISGLFITRTRLAMVISIVISIAGLIALGALPVQQYPNITPPTVNVSATYPGASAEVIADVVGSPLETAINGVEDMLYMSSTSSNAGTYNLSIAFEIGTDEDIAQVNVNNRAQLAISQLPSEVAEQGVSVFASSPDFLFAIGFYSPDGSMSNIEIANFLTTQVVDTIARVPGVGEASIIGAAEYSMRVWMDPARLEALGMTPDDVAAAIRAQNIQASLGEVGGPPAPEGTDVQYTLVAEGRLETPEEFGQIVLRTGADGAVVRLNDVARVDLGAQTYAANATLGGVEAAMLQVNQSPGANAIATADAVQAQLDRLSAGFPEGMDYEIVYDATDFVRASINLIFTIFIEAFIIVLVVTYLFLQDWRATLVSAVAIPVAMLGAVLALLVFGYSLNTVSLLAMVLAIAIVVDDAILVVENVQHVMEDDPEIDPVNATRKAMGQITGPIISTTLVLLAVVTPTAFLPGINGQLYRQFAVVLSSGLVFSAIIALTLSPALASLLMRTPKPGYRRGPLGWFARGVDKVRDLYGRIVGFLVRVWIIPLALLVATFGGAYFLFTSLPATLLPEEDQGAIFVDIQLPEAASLARTSEIIAQAEETLLATEGVEQVLSVAGYSILQGALSPSGGMIVASLAPWEARTEPEVQIDGILAILRAQFATVPGANIAAFAPPAIPGIGAVGGLDLRLQALQGQPPEEIAQVARSFIAEANQAPEIGGLTTTFSADVPQIFVDVDRTRAATLGVNVADVFSTVGSFFGPRYINDFTLGGRVFQVNIQALAEARDTVEDLMNLDVRSDTGALVPLRNLASSMIVLGPDVISRYNLWVSAQINGQVAPGGSSGLAMDAVERVAAETLPEGYGYEWSGLSFQEQQAGGQAMIVFGLALLFAFLFLVAQYESWMLPFSVIFSLGAAAFGAAAALTLLGLQNSVYAQIGIVLLIGIASKNAILIVEFAKERHDERASIAGAARLGAEQRFRAVVMTALALIFGVLPLALATGAGAGAGNSVGVTVVGGMIGATTIGLFVIPPLYAIIQRISEWASPPRNRGEGDPGPDPQPDAERRHQDAMLDEALEETFPASDPVAITIDRTPER